MQAWRHLFASLGEQGLLEPGEASRPKSFLAIHRPHDHDNGGQAGHDDVHLGPLEDPGQDLEIVEVGGADFGSPEGNIVVALNEHTAFALAGFEAG